MGKTGSGEGEKGCEGQSEMFRPGDDRIVAWSNDRRLKDLGDAEGKDPVEDPSDQRRGGEEFLVICPESSSEDTVIVAERIRKIINEELIGDGVRELRVALSAGVTELHENDVNFEKLFSRADLALYKAKEEGRNRVVAL